jgi:hypothetical protein
MVGINQLRFASAHPASLNLIAKRHVTTRRQRSRTASARTQGGKAGTPALTTFDDVREIAHTLPGVEDGTSYGTRALKVSGKLFARIHQNIHCLVLRADLLDREILLQSAPEVFFITEHYRNYPWILVRFGTVEKGALPDLIERAWRMVAPKTLVKKYDGER